MPAKDGTGFAKLALMEITSVNFFRGDVRDLMRFAPK